MNGAIQELCLAIGYPERSGAVGGRFSLTVDGATVVARVDAKRLVLSRVLAWEGDLDEEALGRFARYAAGRALKEDATLAWDPTENALVLWQAVPEDSGRERLKLFFEVFCTSCDWWAARVNEAGRPQVPRPEMVIRP